MAVVITSRDIDEFLKSDTFEEARNKLGVSSGGAGSIGDLDPTADAVPMANGTEWEPLTPEQLKSRLDLANVLSFIGPNENEGSLSLNNFTSSGHVGDGTTVEFTLDFTPRTEIPQAFIVGIDGVLQSPVDAYTVSRTTGKITFASAPPVDSKIVVTTSAAVTGYDISDTTVIATGSTTTRKLVDRFADTLNVKDFGAVGDGVTDDTAAIQAAIDAAVAADISLHWAAGTYLTTSSINNFHSVSHIGTGIITRNGIEYSITPDRETTRSLFVDPSGSNTNDGLSSTEPFSSIQYCVDVINKNGPIVGRQKVIGAGGTYAESITIPDGLAQNENYLEFSFPSVVGIKGDPTSWAVGGAVLDGSGEVDSTGIRIGRYNKVYIEYLLIKNWYDSAVSNVNQVYRGATVDEYSFAWFNGCSAIGNGLDTIAVTPAGSAVITGGIIDGGRRGIDNTGGSLSLTSDRVTNFTTIRNALEYGLYAKHNSRTVIDGAHFEDCGNVTGAETYGSAIFSYKSGTSVDLKGCTYKRNLNCYNVRGGHIARQPSLPEVYGSGVDANTNIWKINGFGEDDLINYESISGRELQKDFTEQSTSSTSYVDVVENSVDVPAGYFVKTNQYLEISIRGVNNGSSDATVRPVLQSDQPTNYALGSYTVSGNSFFEIKITVIPTSGSTQYLFYNNTNATSLGNSIQDASSTLPADTNGWYFKVQGLVGTGTNTLKIKQASCKMWG